MKFLPIAFIVSASLAAFIRYKFLESAGSPWGTLLINLVGSLLIGFLAIYLEKYDPVYKTLLLVAFLGSLTTFSTYSLDLIKLFEEGFLAKALSYAILSNFLCVLGCYFGWKLAQSPLINS